MRPVFVPMRSLLFSLILFCSVAAFAQRAPLPSAQAFAQQAQTLREVQYLLQKLSAQIEVLDQRQNALTSRVAALEQGKGVASKDEVAALRADLSALKSAQEGLRGEIVEDLSVRIAKITQKQEAAAAAARRAREEAARKSGYNHVVEAGQTISAIAQAYGVSSQTIMKANRITDPSKLQVGQKLFIPDP